MQSNQLGMEGIIVFEQDYFDFYSEELDSRDISPVSVAQKNLCLPSSISRRLLDELEISQYRVDFWYSNLVGVTFSSSLIALGRDEVDLLLHWVCSDKQKQRNLINRIVKQVSHLKLSLPLFVRLSECSAKDETNGVLKANTHRSWTKLLNRMSSSSRIREGLTYYKEISPPTFLVLREKVDIPAWPGEFRCFVFDSRLTAFCTHAGDDRIKARDQNPLFRLISQNFQHRVLSQLPWTRAVVDIVFLSKLQFQVIECNPFHAKVTGAALFSWQEDLALLKGFFLQDHGVAFRQGETQVFLPHQLNPVHSQRG